MEIFDNYGILECINNNIELFTLHLGGEDKYQKFLS